MGKYGQMVAGTALGPCPTICRHTHQHRVQITCSRLGTAVLCSSTFQQEVMVRTCMGQSTT